MLGQIRQIKSIFPRRFYGSFIFLFFLSMLGNILEIFGIGSFYIFLSSALESNNSLITGIMNSGYFSNFNDSENLLLYILVISLILFASRILIQFLALNFSLNISKKLYYYYSKFMFNGYLKLDYLNFLKNNTQKMMLNVWSHTMEVVAKSIIGLIEILISGIMILFLFVTMLLLETKLTLLITLIFCFIGFIYLILINKNLFKFNKKIIIIHKRIIQLIKEMVEGIKTIKVLNSTELFMRTFNSNASLNFDLKKKIDLLNNMPKFILEFVLLLLIFSFLIFHLVNGNDFQGIIPTLGLIVLVGARLIPNMNRMMISIQQFKNSYPSLLSILDDYLIFKNHSAEKTSYKPFDFSHQLRLSKVGMEYENSNNKISNISMNIKKAQIVGFIGESGSGKTSVMNIILGLINPRFGEYFIDNVNVTNKQAYRYNHFSYVPQRNFILEDTIRSNITMGLDNKKDIWSILKMVYLEDLVNSLPKKLEYQISESGKNFSGGECQRISIARAIYNDNQIICFDEPTSSLDLKNKKKFISLLNNLKKRNMTIILISHDEDIFKKCDNLYFFKKGKICAEGDYKTLKKNKIFLEFISKNEKKR